MRQCDSGISMTAESVVVVALSPFNWSSPHTSSSQIAVAALLPFNWVCHQIIWTCWEGFRGLLSVSCSSTPHQSMTSEYRRTGSPRGILLLCRWDTTSHSGCPHEFCMPQGKTRNFRGNTERSGGCPDNSVHREGESRRMIARQFLKACSLFE